VQRRAIYSWLTRLDTGKSPEQAGFNDKQSGRKQEFSKYEHEEFRDELKTGRRWTPP
jgi:hypothetical protein